MTTNQKLYLFNSGYWKPITSLFYSTPKMVQRYIGSTVHIYEPYGKHSSTSIKIEESMITELRVPNKLKKSLPDVLKFLHKNGVSVGNFDLPSNLEDQLDDDDDYDDDDEGD